MSGGRGGERDVCEVLAKFFLPFGRPIAVFAFLPCYLHLNL